jgi:phosphoglucosamine mutase
MLVDACVLGLRAAGADVVDLGVLPTPGLSWWLAERGSLEGGIMITASHNPWHDNGLKLFAHNGDKASDEVQTDCERLYERMVSTEDREQRGEQRVINLHDEAFALYLASLGATLPVEDALKGRKVVADTAAGAAFEILPQALRLAGANVVTCAPVPDGRNINAGWGAVEPQAMARRVVQETAWAGVAVDGDGDRVVLADELGCIHDGDALIGFLAGVMQEAGTLRGGQVVGTVMTNGGLEAFLGGRGLQLLRTAVGDRNITAAMKDHNLNLGGEGSGHVLTPDLCPTGDGTRVAMHVLALAAQRQLPVSQLLSEVPNFPSAQRKVRTESRPDLESLDVLQRVIADCELKLTPTGGRLLLRYSGTEPMLRILVEGRAETLVEECANALEEAAVTSLKDF